MSEAYIGEIRMFAGNFPPMGWMFCDGQMLRIQDYDVLYSLIGTTYGGDGFTNFALPDFRGRIPVHRTSGFNIGQGGGAEQVSLTAPQLPAHTHPLYGSNDTASTTDTAGHAGAHTGATVLPYGTDAPLQALSSKAVSSAGGGAAHDNVQPFLCLEFIIAVEGIYPQQS